jgi:hypothetical protein
MRWIISRREDLLWFHLPLLPALLLGALFALGPKSLELPALCLWGIFLDGTHVFATWARSYLSPDRDELRRRGELPGAASLWLLAVGPAAALVDHLGAPIFPLFLLAAYLWAYWHLVRQHRGFLALYLRGAPSRLGWLLWLGCLFPFACFGLSDAYLDSGLPRLFPPSLLLPLALAAACALATIAVARLFDRRPLRLGPAHLYVAIVVALHLLTFAFVRKLFPIMATLTLFHNLQYHRLVWRYEAGRGRIPFGGLRRYLGAGILLGSLWYLPRVLGAAAAPPLVRDLLLGAGWGVAFHHYLVDGRIWRLRRPQLRAALGAT